MLKKAAIALATAATSFVALSPFAFASDHDTEITGIDKSGSGLVNLSGNNVVVPIQACNNDVSVAGVGGAVQKLDVPFAAALGLLAPATSQAESTYTDGRTCGLSAEGDSVES